MGTTTQINETGMLQMHCSKEDDLIIYNKKKEHIVRMIIGSDFHFYTAMCISHVIYNF
jgi:hypothetical protein